MFGRSRFRKKVFFSVHYFATFPDIFVHQEDAIMVTATENLFDQLISFH